MLGTREHLNEMRLEAAASVGDHNIRRVLPGKLDSHEVMIGSLPGSILKEQTLP